MIKQLLAASLTTILVSGCATTEMPNELQALQEREAKLAQDHAVAKYAGDAFKEASAAVASAAQAWKDDQDKLTEHKMYVSDKLLSHTEMRSRLGAMETEFAKADKRRAQLEIDRQKQALSNKQKEIDALKRALNKAGTQQSNQANVLTLGDMLFAFDADQLHPGSRTAVNRLADFLKKYPDVNIVIEGYTDAQGSESYNQALSERRAKAVQAALLTAGISAARIEVKGYGEANPVASNTNPAGRQHNRRVEVVILDEDENYQTPKLTQSAR